MPKNAYHCPKCGVPIKSGTMVTAQDQPVVLIRLDGTVERSSKTIWMCDRCWREYDAVG